MGSAAENGFPGPAPAYGVDGCPAGWFYVGLEGSAFQFGIVGALFLACRATGKPGDEVFRPAIIYPPFVKAPQMNAQIDQSMPMVMRDEDYYDD